MRAALVVRRAALSAVLMTLSGCTGAPTLTTAPSLVSAAPTTAPTIAPSPATPTEAPPSQTTPPSGRIAFAQEADDEESSDVFIVGVDGLGLQQVTNDARREHGLIWAPDGGRLYFESGRTTICGETYCFPNRLFSIKPDGSDFQDLGRIGSSRFFATGGIISPDRQHAAVPGDGEPDGLRIVILDLRLGSVERLPDASTEVRWSPDSHRLLLLHIGKGIEVVDAATGETVRRVDDPGVQSVIGWTPGGDAVIYRRCDPELPKDKVLACLAGLPWTVTVEDPSVPANHFEGLVPPAFGAPSPDGLWIATVEPDGLYIGPNHGERQLVFAAEIGDNEQYPAWSPDSEWIAFAGPRAIHLVPRTGGEPRLLPPGYSPAWQPPVID